MSRRSFSINSGRLVEEPVVNLTPLIDVVFVILIAFIVIAPLLELERIQLAEAGVPDDSKVHSVQENSPIAIYVREDDTILLNGEEVAIEELTARLLLARKQFPRSQPQLFQDKNARFGTYQSVKNAVESAGFKELDLILKPSS